MYVDYAQNILHLEHNLTNIRGKADVHSNRDKLKNYLKYTHKQLFENVQILQHQNKYLHINIK